MLALFLGVALTILSLIEPILDKTLVITCLGFIATIVISLFSLLRTEQQTAERKEHIKESILDLIEEVGAAEGLEIEAHSGEGLRRGLSLIIGRAIESLAERQHK